MGPLDFPFYTGGGFQLVGELPTRGRIHSQTAPRRFRSYDPSGKPNAGRAANKAAGYPVFGKLNLILRDDDMDSTTYG